MNITIHQPSYLPWIPFLEKGLRSDIYVMLDTVQFEKNSEQNRNQIKTPNGAGWLTVPVSRNSKSLVSEIQIAGNGHWQTKHRRAIEHNYRKAPFFKQVAEPLFAILDHCWTSLLDLNFAIDDLFLGMADFRGQIVRASELNVGGCKSDRILAICQALGAETYLSGPSGADYLDLVAFQQASIQVLFQDYAHREYPQRFPKTGFTPRLSALDLFMNLGPGENTKRWILENSRWRTSQEVRPASETTRR